MSLKKRIGRPVKLKTFKERLKFLIGSMKPYAWCKQVGIEKGLFQYYWQKGKIPKYENLIKIRNAMGCSLDWLMTGEGEPFPDRIEDMDATAGVLADQMDALIGKLETHVVRLKSLRDEVQEAAPN